MSCPMTLPFGSETEYANKWVAGFGLLSVGWSLSLSLSLSLSVFVQVNRDSEQSRTSRNKPEQLQVDSAGPPK